jgi:hypothetical protein
MFEGLRRSGRDGTRTYRGQVLGIRYCDWRHCSGMADRSIAISAAFRLADCLLPLSVCLCAAILFLFLFAPGTGCRLSDL